MKSSSFLSGLIVVVIGVIAAAILFPVFAQSKQAAKKTAALSRLKAEQADSLEAGDTQPTTVSRESLLDERMVIRTATVTMRVDSVEKAEKAVNSIVAAQGGYVTNATSSDLASDYPVMTITMRVPVGTFERTLSGIEGLGTRLNKGVSSHDVTEQVVDLDARIKTMATQEETFRGLLRGARDLESVMSLQERLTNIRSEIESLQAQRTSLSKQAAFSTITLTLEQSAVATAPPKDPNWLAQSWGEATTAMGAVTRYLAVIAVWLAVFSPIWCLLALAAFRFWKATHLKRLPTEA